MKTEITKFKLYDRFTSGQMPVNLATKFVKSLFAGQLVRQVEPGRFEDAKRELQRDLRSQILM